MATYKQPTKVANVIVGEEPAKETMRKANVSVANTRSQERYFLLWNKALSLTANIKKDSFTINLYYCACDYIPNIICLHGFVNCF